MTQPANVKWATRAKCVALAAGGCLAIVVGGAMILLIYAHAAMISPQLTGWDRWAMILEKMFLRTEVVPVLFGVFAIGVGLASVAAAVRLALARQTGRHPTFALIGVLLAAVLCLAVLLCVAM